ncbi:MAG TPA: hypothetical protein VF845_03750 [Terriglobales bacterium]
MLPRDEYSVTIPVSVDAAFYAFQDLNRLLHRGIYEEASWIEGKPWEVGSRLRYVVIKPVEATIFAVVSSVSPPRAISLLNHALGIVADQHVTFGPDLKGGTRVRMMLEFVGEPTELPESVVQEAVAFLAKDVLDTLSALFDQPRGSSASGK